MENAKGHLDCFCSSLSSQSHVNVRPQYIIREESDKDDSNPLLLMATVILPVTLDPTPRICQRCIFTLKDEAGLTKWQIEDADSSHSSEHEINTNILGHFK
jgi:hypothetical protein